jgi:hypothetical protein
VEKDTKEALNIVPKTRKETKIGVDLQSIFRNAHRQLRPRTPLPEIQIEFFPFAGLNHTARLLENG